MEMRELWHDEEELVTDLSARERSESAEVIDALQRGDLLGADDGLRRLD